MTLTYRCIRALAPLSAAIALGGCVDATSELTSLDQHQFFANSTRRDATPNESSLVVNLDGCAAFFVANTQGKTYLATARHCVDYSISNWCRGGGQVVDNEGRAGTCTRVIAADAKHDITIFEANMPYVPDPDRVLRLASYAPAINTRLTMIGYPADEDPETARQGRLTTTESCWILSDTVPSPYNDLLDRSSLHNCTTYGGNSGGPMYIEGSLHAVGLPFTYVPDDYERRSPTDLSTAAAMAQMADFVETFRSKLTSAGVIISDTPPSP